jgi:ArsR family transcriptional regulator, arsenate/arsenite/antimonite-responsive transcriptional repressor
MDLAHGLPAMPASRWIGSGCDFLGRLTFLYKFDTIKNMESTQAIAALAALAQETRLSIFRLLVQSGEGGRAAGDIAQSLGVPAATLSFHLKELARAGLISGRQAGRSIIYSADFPAMHGLIDYLSENCCGGQPCKPSLCVPGESP